LRAEADVVDHNLASERLCHSHDLQCVAAASDSLNLVDDVLSDPCTTLSSFRRGTDDTHGGPEERSTLSPHQNAEVEEALSDEIEDRPAVASNAG
jgi:hypothetical protein